MLRNWMQKGLLVTAGVLLMAAVVPLGYASAQSRDDVCTGVGAASGATTGGCDLPDGATSVQNVIAVVINILSGIVGIASVVMVIFGGYKYTTSNGDSGKLASAQQTIIYAIVGGLFVAVSQVLVVFFVRRATEAPPAEPADGALIMTIRPALIEPSRSWYK